MEKNEKNKSEKIPKNSVSLHIIESALSSPDGNISGVLRGEMPKLTGAEDKAKVWMAWELIYKKGATLKGNDPPNST